MSSKSREIVIRTLVRNRLDGSKVSDLIDEYAQTAQLDTRERSFITKLCFGVIQNSGICDYYLDYYAKGKLEPKLRDILRTGVYQLLYMDRVPDHAAINECVSLSKKMGYSRAAGLVNAVLRRIASDRDQEKLPEIPDRDKTEYLRILYSHDESLIKYLVSEYGTDFTEQFLAANNKLPPITLQLNTLKINAADFANLLSRNGFYFEYDERVPGAINLLSGTVDQLPGYKEGFFYVQDIAPAMVMNEIDYSVHKDILDVCASPGGKSIAAAIHLNNTGHILSCDLTEEKVHSIHRNFLRMGIKNADICVADAQEYNYGKMFDAVIADVPCSGFGVIRKKPEIRHKSIDSVKDLPNLQLRILSNASKYVKCGGVLLYSTCTILKEENEKVLERFLEIYPEFELTPMSISAKGFYTFWPHIDGTDGFFAAKLVRKA